MIFRLECNVSGVGEDFEGSLKGAVNRARELIRFPQINSATIIWLQGERVAAIRTDPAYDWIRPDAATLCRAWDL